MNILGMLNCCFLIVFFISLPVLHHAAEATKESSDASTPVECGEMFVIGEDDATDENLQIKPNTSLLDYLNPKLFEDPTMMEEVGRRLKGGELVVIRNAFKREFADYVWQDLNRDDVEWELVENYFDNGFSFHHHNVYDYGDYAQTVTNQARAVFLHDKSKKFIQELTGRDCSGPGDGGSATRYFPGDYSLVHSDYNEMRSVAFVWHLSKDWQPEWGGGLSWCGESNPHNAYIPASYNTLNIFSVTHKSNHFVTRVSHHSTSTKRLTYNGWYEASGIPALGDPFEVLYDTAKKRLNLAASQYLAFISLSKAGEQDSVRRAKLEDLETTAWKERFQPREESFILDLS